MPRIGKSHKKLCPLYTMNRYFILFIANGPAIDLPSPNECQRHEIDVLGSPLGGIPLHYFPFFFQESVQKWVEGADFDSDGRISKDLTLPLRDLGAFGLNAKLEDGGQGLCLTETLRIIEEFSANLSHYLGISQRNR